MLVHTRLTLYTPHHTELSVRILLFSPNQANDNTDHLVSTLQRNRMEISVSIGLRDSRAHYTYRSTTGLDLSWDLSGINSANLTNATNSSTDCNLLLDNSSLRDGNIPQVLGISIAAWAAMLLIFIFIRCCARDYSRIGLVASKHWATALYSKKSSSFIRKHGFSPSYDEDKYWYTWLFFFFIKLRDKDVLQRCGPDASLYLSLERYLIALLCVLSFLSLVVILPINYFAGSLAEDGFPRTTISNLPPGAGVLWVHTLFSLLYLCITVIFVVHYSLKLGKTQQELSNLTVMVQWIPKIAHREDILHHLQEALPDTDVADMQMAYDVSRLTKLSEKISEVREKLEVVESLKTELNEDKTIRVGWGKVCCWNDEYQTDARAYYELHHRDLVRDFAQEQPAVKKKRLGIGFITFSRQKDASSFLSSYKLCRRRPHSSMYDSVQAGWWWVSMAPFPLDILWENLSVDYVLWWIRWLLINAILIVFLFFFTTPAILLASVKEIEAHLFNVTDEEIAAKFNLSPLVTTYFASLLLLLFASLLPFCVSRTSYLEAHWTKSFREQTIMRKTFIFLTIMLIILPSIGLTSFNVLWQLALKGQEVFENRLQCVFLPNNGAFFIGYVITTTFVGTAVELLRIPELVVYVYHRMTAKTRLQREQALRKAACYDFMYGVQYAWNLVIFALVLAFSLTTPLIVPFGVLYFILKFYVDKYNIYYVYRPASFNGRQFLHRSAINFVIVGAVYLQVATLFFSIVRLGRLDPRTVLMIVALALTGTVCIGFMFFGWLSHLLPHLRIKMGKEYHVFGLTRAGESPEEGKEENTEKGVYIPPVLKESPPQSQQSGDSVKGYQSFGSTDHMGRHCPSSASPQINVTPEQTTNVEVQGSADPSSDSDTHPLINPTVH